MTEQTEATEVVETPVPDVEPSELTAEQVEMLAYLNSVVDAGNAIAQQACAERMNNESIHDATVNWADFNCIGAEVYMDNDGARGVRATFSEAAPENARLRQYVTDKFQNAGLPNIEVYFEW